MTRRRGKGRWVLALLFLAGLGWGAWAWLHRPSAPPPPPLSPGQVQYPSAVATAQALAPTALPTPSGPRLALVIDDWGYQSKPIEALAGLGIPLTTAILPNLEYSARAAETSHGLGHEVILHCPMQAQGKARAEAGTLMAGMQAPQALALLAKHWDSVPFAVGLNNHEGSKASEDMALMAVVASFLQGKNAYFLDSVTTSKSAIPKAARAVGVPWAARRIFLDNLDQTEAIRTALNQAVASARKHGSCIAIGHPRPRTLEVLREEGPRLQAQGILLVHVSDLLKR